MDTFQATWPSAGRVLGLLLGGLLLAAGSPAQADTRPTSFNFVDVTVSDAQLVFSNVVTVRGIDAPTPMLVSGNSLGRFQINAGLWRSGSATVNAGDRIRLRLTSRAMGSPGVVALTVDIGGGLGVREGGGGQRGEQQAVTGEHGISW